jgi:hypothetical protein
MSVKIVNNRLSLSRHFQTLRVKLFLKVPTPQHTGLEKNTYFMGFDVNKSLDNMKEDFYTYNY